MCGVQTRQEDTSALQLCLETPSTASSLRNLCPLCQAHGGFAIPLSRPGQLRLGAHGQARRNCHITGGLLGFLAASKRALGISPRAVNNNEERRKCHQKRMPKSSSKSQLKALQQECHSHGSRGVSNLSPWQGRPDSRSVSPAPSCNHPPLPDIPALPSGTFTTDTWRTRAKDSIHTAYVCTAMHVHISPSIPQHRWQENPNMLWGLTHQQKVRSAT